MYTFYKFGHRMYTFYDFLHSIQHIHNLCNNIRDHVHNHYSFILCKLIYPGYITFCTCCNCIPQDKVLQHLQSFRLSLQPSSVWRNLQIVLETNGNANRIPQTASPPSPLVVPAPFSVSPSLMMLFQIGGKRNTVATCFEYHYPCNIQVQNGL